MSTLAESTTADLLAADIREVDGNHSLGAGALAEALAAKGWIKSSATDPLVVREFLHNGLGYVIRRGSNGAYFWEWLEPGEPIDAAERDYSTELEAIRAAHLDWETNGSGNIWPFVATMKLAAEGV